MNKQSGKLRMWSKKRPARLTCKQGHRVPTEVVEETWVEVPVGEWVAAFRLLRKHGELVIAEVRVFPDEGDRSEPGRWSREESSVPEGGIPAKVLRQLNLSAVRDLFPQAVASFESQHGDSAVTQVLKRHGLGAQEIGGEETGTPRP